MSNQVYFKEFCGELGALLKQARLERGLKLEEAALRTGHSIDTLQNIENGSDGILAVKSLSRIYHMFITYNKRLHLKTEGFNQQEAIEHHSEKLITLLQRQIGEDKVKPIITALSEAVPDSKIFQTVKTN